jgi:hypothetical protein
MIRQAVGSVQQQDKRLRGLLAMVTFSFALGLLARAFNIDSNPWRSAFTIATVVPLATGVTVWAYGAPMGAGEEPDDLRAPLIRSVWSLRRRVNTAADSLLSRRRWSTGVLVLSFALALVLAAAAVIRQAERALPAVVAALGLLIGTVATVAIGDLHERRVRLRLLHRIDSLIARLSDMPIDTAISPSDHERVRNLIRQSLGESSPTPQLQAIQRFWFSERVPTAGQGVSTLGIMRRTFEHRSASSDAKQRVH